MSDDSRSPRLFSPPAHVDPSGQGILPGFGVDRPPPVAWPLELFRMGGGSDAAKGRGISLALRLFVEAILAISMDERDGQPRTFNVSLKELTDWVYPNGLPGGNRRTLFQRLEHARLALFNTRIPVYDLATGRHELRNLVFIGGTPFGPADMAGNVRIHVDLPRGYQRGPQAPAALRQLAVADADAWRLLLNFAYLWYHPGVTLRPQGGPRADGKGQFWGQSNNPDHYTPVSDDALAAMANPVSQIQERRTRLHRARAALERLEEAGEVRVITEGRTRLILPPRKQFRTR